MPSFNFLPSEIHALIIQHSHNLDLKSIRLVSKKLSTLATHQLFSHLTLLPTSASQERYNSILARPDLAQQVRSIKIQTHEGTGTGPGNSGNVVAGEFSDAFIKAILEIGRLENLNAVQVVFHEDVTASTDVEVAEQPYMRDEFLDFLLAGLNSEAFPVTKLKSLSIKNLQNLNEPDIVESVAFKKVLGRLEELRLRIVTEYEHAAPENSWLFPEMHSFFKKLPDVWLKHCQENLKRLTIHADIYWGYYPRIDLRKTHFKRLEYLEFGNYVFTHDWQLDWICEHKTLKAVILDDCPIASRLRCSGRLDEEKYNPFGFPQDGTTRGAPSAEVWTYDRRWNYYLTQLAERLPELRELVVGSGDWNSGVNFDRGRFGLSPFVAEDEEDLWNINDEMAYRYGPMIGITGKRYIVFDQGLGPSPWIEWRGDQGYDHPTNLDGDTEKDDRKGLEHAQKVLLKRM